MTTETITDTTPRPFGAPARPTKMQVCHGCRWLVATDARALGDGVGWCMLSGQYRSLRIERECSEFRTRTTES